MFQSIKKALAKNEGSGAKYKEILKLEVGNTYTVRLLPNIKSPKDTFVHYYTFGWQSFATGQNILITSPTSWNERDPIAEERYRVYRHGTPEEKKRMEAVRRSENWLVKAYIISDPVNPENNAKVKAIRYGRQINKIVMSAMEGEESEEFGSRIFDLSKEGCNFKIKVEKQGEYPSYVTSKFQFPKEIEGLNTSDHEKIYNNDLDLKSLLTIKSYDELKEIFDQHYFCKTTETKPVEVSQPLVNIKHESAPAPVVSTEEEDLEALLKDLDVSG
jgi:hypothetical protein